MNIKHAPCLAVTTGMSMDNGLIVNVLSYFPMSGATEHGHCWRVESIGSPFHMTVKRLSQTCVLPDRHLRPIDGLDEPEQVTESTPERETA